MRIEPIKQIKQLTYKNKAKTWEDFNEIYKFTTNDKQIIPPEKYRPDDGGCIANGTRKDITKSGENIDIII